jgi:hypothetical protein
MSVNVPQSALDPILAPVLRFMPPGQLAALHYALNGEERAGIAELVAKVAATMATMPRTYQTDNQADNAVIHLHYFRGGCDWYITELDKEGYGGEQAFGLVVLNGDTMNASLGYICIDELVGCGVEMDLYWSPITLAAAKQKHEQ